MPDELRYRLRGAASKMFSCTATEQLIAGPAGTGKSLACLLRIYNDAMSMPCLRCLIVRKTRASLTESALVTFERDVLGPDHPLVGRVTRAGRRVYGPMPNGSQIVVAGMDSAAKVMSTDFDRIYVQEAIDLAEAEWEALTTRVSRSGRAGMVIGDTNPDKPTHWLKKRCDSGRTKLWESRHEDNPILFDSKTNTWTMAGAKYLEILDALTGPRKQRLRHGRWVQSEGIVYDGWDAATHVVDRFEIPPTWARYLAIDFGYTNPFSAQWWATDGDGRLYLYREIYHTQRLVEDHAKHILELSRGEPEPEAVICDTDAEDRATLERYLSWQTIAAHKDRSPGIQAVASRLRPAGDSKPRLVVLRGSLVERDPELEARKKPCGVAEEIDGYIWDTSSNKKQGEEPLKRDDHAMDAMRYMVMHLDAGSSMQWWEARRVGQKKEQRQVDETLITMRAWDAPKEDDERGGSDFMKLDF